MNSTCVGQPHRLWQFEKSALQQLEAVEFDKRRQALLEAELAALGEDEAFWRLQAHLDAPVL